MSFVPDGNARALHALCLMSTDGLGMGICEFCPRRSQLEFVCFVVAVQCV